MSTLICFVPVQVILEAGFLLLSPRSKERCMSTLMLPILGQFVAHNSSPAQLYISCFLLCRSSQSRSSASRLLSLFEAAKVIDHFCRFNFCCIASVVVFTTSLDDFSIHTVNACVTFQILSFQNTLSIVLLSFTNKCPPSNSFSFPFTSNKFERHDGDRQTEMLTTYRTRNRLSKESRRDADDVYSLDL